MHMYDYVSYKDMQVNSPNVTYTDGAILSRYNHVFTKVEGNVVTPVSREMVFKTETRVPKLGVMLVGWGGNNGSTYTAGVLANRLKLSWNTKEGVRRANYLGSLTQSSTVRLGEDATGKSIYIPFKDMLPMVDPNDIVIGGWDINSSDLGTCMARSQVVM